MSALTLSTFAQKTINVAKDGSGDYTTIQDAINAVSDEVSCWPSLA